MVAEAFTGIFGIYLFYLGCKNYLSTLKLKHSFIKVLLCIGFVIASIVISALFLIPFMSPSQAGENSVLFGGYFSFVISLLIKMHFLKSKKDTTDERKSIKKELIWTILIPVVIIALLFGFDAYKTLSCEFPQMIVGGVCCPPNTDFGMVMCLNDSLEFNRQLEYQINNEILTKEHKEIISNSFEILIPPDYFYLKNGNVGNFELPLYLFAYGEDQETPLLIYGFYFEDDEYSTIYETYDEFNKGLLKGISLVSAESVSSEPEFFANKQDVDVAMVELNVTSGSEQRKTTTAILKNGKDTLALFYVSLEPYYSVYKYEFEDMIYSARGVNNN